MSQLPVTETAVAKAFWKRWLYILLAVLSMVLGTLGIFIPGLPTIDFYLLASFFSAKGSRRLHLWFVNHRWFGPVLQQWREHRTIPKRAKYFSLVSMSLSAVLIAYSISNLWIVAGLILCMVAVQIWMWTKA